VAVLERLEAATLLGPAARVHGADVVRLLGLFATAGRHRVVPVHRGDVVSVGAVFGLQLSVAVVHVGRGTAQHLETLRRLVDNQVDDLGGFAEVLGERHNIRIEATEQETTIGFEAGDLCQIMRAFLVETFGVSRPSGFFTFSSLPELVKVHPWNGQVKTTLLPRLKRQSIAPR
jgi:hypothetical protein